MRYNSLIMLYPILHQLLKLFESHNIDIDHMILCVRERGAAPWLLVSVQEGP